MNELQNNLILLLLLLPILTITSCRNYEFDFDGAQQQYFSEHNHLIRDQKIFSGDTRLDFKQVERLDDNNILYLAQNEIENIDYFEVIVPGEEDNVQVPQEPSSYEIGQLTTTGNKVWAINFPFIPDYFTFKDWGNLDSSPVMVVAGHRSNKISFAVLSKEGEVLFEDSYETNVISVLVQNVFNLPNTNNFILSGAAFLSDNDIVPYVAEINVDPVERTISVVKEKLIRAYDAWPVSILQLADSEIGTYVLTLQHLPGNGGLVFLDEEFDIKKHTSVGMSLFEGLFNPNVVIVADEQIYITGEIVDPNKEEVGGNYKSFLVKSYSFSGEENWSTYSNLSQEYTDVAHSLFLSDNFLYAIGEHAAYCNVDIDNGEEKRRKCYSNGFLAQYDKVLGILNESYTFSQETNPWNVSELDIGVIIDENIFLWGSVNRQEQAGLSTTISDGWMFYVPESDL